MKALLHVTARCRISSRLTCLANPRTLRYDTPSIPKCKYQPWAHRRYSHITPALSSSTREMVKTLGELTDAPVPPSTQEILQYLNRCEPLISSLRAPAGIEEKEPQALREDTSSSSLSLLEDRAPSSRASAEQSVAELSNALFALVKAPHIFLSPEVLSLYIDLQSKLGHPETFPKVLKMFANKPIPIQGTRPVKFKNQNPRSVKAAVPEHVANKALNAVIETKILSLCLDIVDETARQPAFTKRRLLTRAWPLVAGMGLTPPLAYALATKFNEWQITMTESYATWTSFTAICCYIYFTGTIGYVALTTSNDQMERVTWQQGIPLWERWAREDERAMLDKIAMAWGFKVKRRRGEEVGPEWEALKELVSMRDMVLDKTELMEGME